MALSLEAISDRMEIQDLLSGYAFAMEAHDWDALDLLFTEDAVIDYRQLHGTRGDVATTKRFMAAASRRPGGSQYMVATTKVTLAGDTATARSIGHHPVVLDQGEGRTHVFFCGIWYDDRFVRTAQGWRIAERVVERCYYHNLPPEMAFLEAAHTDVGCACSQMAAIE